MLPSLCRIALAMPLACVPMWADPPLKAPLPPLSLDRLLQASPGQSTSWTALKDQKDHPISGWIGIDKGGRSLQDYGIVGWPTKVLVDASGILQGVGNASALNTPIREALLVGQPIEVLVLELVSGQSIRQPHKLRPSTSTISRWGQPGDFRASALSTGVLAAMASQNLQKLFIDETGLSGRYDFELRLGLRQAAARAITFVSIPSSYRLPGNQRCSAAKNCSEKTSK